MRRATLVSSYAGVEVAMNVVSVRRMNWLTSDGKTTQRGLQDDLAKDLALLQAQGKPSLGLAFGVLSAPPRMISIA